MARSRRLRLRRSSTRPTIPTMPPSGSGRSSRPRPAATRRGASGSELWPRWPAGSRCASRSTRSPIGPSAPSATSCPMPRRGRARARSLLVPYGRRLALGYLLPGDARGPEPRASSCATVEAVVSGPMLTPDLLALAEEIAAYYRAPLGTTLAAMLPPGLESRLDATLGGQPGCRRPAGRAARLARRVREVADAALSDCPAPRPERVARAAAPIRRPAGAAGRSDRRSVKARRVRTLRRLPDAERQPRAALRSSERSSTRWAAASGPCRTWRRRSTSSRPPARRGRRLVALGAAEHGMA